MATAFGAWENVRTCYYVDKIDRSVTLNGDLTAAATTIPTNEDTVDFPTSGSLQIDDECCNYTGKTTNSFTGVTRAKNNSLAATHTSGATIYQLLPTTRGSAGDYFADDADIGDCLYFPASSSWTFFKGLRFNVGTQRDGTVTVVWEYSYRDSTTDWGWEEIPSVVDNTAGLTVAGTNDVTWNTDDFTKSIFASSALTNMTVEIYVRCRITAVASAITEGGKQASGYVQADRDALVVSGGSLSSPNEITDLYTADVAAGWGIISRSSTEGTNNVYYYEITRPIYINGGYLRFKNCSVTWRLPCLTVTYINNAFMCLSQTGTSAFVMGTISNGIVNDAAYVTTSWLAGISGTDSAMYGGSWRGGSHITTTFNKVMEASLYGVGTFPFTGTQVLRNVRFYNFAEGALYGRVGGTVPPVGLETINCRLLSFDQPSNTTNYLYGLKQVTTGNFIKVWRRYNTNAYYIRDYLADDNAISIISTGGAGSTITFYFQFSCAIKVMDTSGVAINGATVSITDIDGTNIGSFITGLVDTGYFFKDTTAHTKGSVQTFSLTEQPTSPARLDVDITDFDSTGYTPSQPSITITGTDVQDQTLVETIMLSGNGTYTSLKTFKTVSSSGVSCSAAWGGSFKIHMDGRIYEQYLTKKECLIVETDTTGSIGTMTAKTPHTVTISATGYQTKTMVLTMDRKREEVVVLEKAVGEIIAKGEVAINTDPENSQSDVFV